MPFRAWISEIVLGADTRLQLNPTSVVVLVGPNNVGKTLTLREIEAEFQDPARRSFISGLKVASEGSAGELAEWVTRAFPVARSKYGGQELIYGTRSTYIPKGDLLSTAERFLQGKGGTLARLAIRFNSASARVKATEPSDSCEVGWELPDTPAQLLYEDDKLERRVAEICRDAFGAGVVVNRFSGSRILLHWTSEPPPSAAEGVTKQMEALHRLPRLDYQGDGIRSFVGALLLTLQVNCFVELDDEPEAFLHPPQAYALGRFFARSIAHGSKQRFVATHSIDFLRGITGANADVTVVRLRVEDGSRVASVLSATQLRTFMSDPLLRHSNALDGLFHEAVVLCEADSDVRFYSAIVDALREQGVRVPDVLFSYVGGKAAFKKVVPALRALGCRVAVVADLDLLNDEETLRGIVVAADGNWSEYSSLWKRLDAAVKELGSVRPPVSDVRKNILDVLADGNPRFLEQKHIDRISGIISIGSGWRLLKRSGLKALPPGNATSGARELVEKLKLLGIHVVESGELESFETSIGGHGPAWVTAVLEQYPDLSTAPALGAARDFVSEVLAQTIRAPLGRVPVPVEPQPEAPLVAAGPVPLVAAGPVPLVAASQVPLGPQQPATVPWAQLGRSLGWITLGALLMLALLRLLT